MAGKIRKGDTVQVMSGDDKGKTGRVLAIDWDKQRVLIERVNMVKRHQKSRKPGMQSGIIEKEAPIHLSNILVYDPKSQRGARIGMRGEGKNRERVSKVSGEPLPKPEK
jgi:large subunit ribosomal protein L24